MAYVKNVLAVVSVWLLQAVTLTATDYIKHSSIIAQLKEYSDPDVIPIPNNGTLNVDIYLSLIKIIEVDNNLNEIEVVLWQGVYWSDLSLRWWGIKRNVTGVALPTKYLWVPDIFIFNAISSAEVLSPAVTRVSNDGYVNWFTSIRVRITCDLQNLTSNSGANCTVKLGSWTRNGNVLSISNPGAGFDLTEYKPIPNYEVLSTSSTKNSKIYPCCPETYEDIDFQFTIRQRSQSVLSSE